MKQRTRFTLLGFLLAAGASAQEVISSQTPTVVNPTDNSAFTISESQLNDDDDVSKSVFSATGVKDDPFLDAASYSFGPMRFQLRGYDSQYNDILINGVKFNNTELGRFNYTGVIGGLNDVTRNEDATYGLQAARFGFGQIGGASNYNIRPSQLAQGNKLTLSGSNRSYNLRAAFTHTQALANNYYVTFSTSYRWGNEGYVDGTFYNAFAYFFAIEKVFNERHRLSLSTWGTPIERAQQGASTMDAYKASGSNFYNPNWGYQTYNDGTRKKRNQRVVTNFEPSVLLSHTWTFDKKSSLTTGLAFKYTKYATTALGWYGNASDPRPDYYKYLPGYDGGNAINAANWETEDGRQIDWDRLYQINVRNNALGGSALYNMEKRHSDQAYLSLNSTFNNDLTSRLHLSTGIDVSTTKGMHYKTLDDLLGADYFLDTDKYATREYGTGSEKTQNDLDNPNRIIKEGDTFGYNYNIFVNKVSGWAQVESNTTSWMSSFAGVKAGGTQMWREGLMRSGRVNYAKGETSKGDSKTKYFAEFAAKIGTTFRLHSKHTLTINATAEQRAPLARNVFINPQINNSYINNLEAEKILSVDASYKFQVLSFISGKVTAYYTRFFDQTEIENFFNDDLSTYIFQSLTGIQKEHKGLEASLVVGLASNLKLTGVASVASYRYMNNPMAQWSNEYNTEEYESKRVYAKGYHTNSTPETAMSIALDYSYKGWFFNVTSNWYDRIFVDFSPIRRTVGNELYVDASGNSVYQEQEMLHGGWMLDASIGKYIRLKKGKSLSINLSMSNLTNNENMRTGGYEQNRLDGTKYATKYYYAYGLNGFLNVGFKF